MTDLHAIDTQALAALEAELARQLALVDCFGPDWTRPRTAPQGHVYDVVIVGGGQSGLATAFGLRRERINNILVLDENPEGFEGPWETYARMITLRTPKGLTPIDYGIPALTPQAWYEACFGAAAWQALDKIPRGVWMEYLRWYRRVLNLPVRNSAKVTGITHVGDGLYSVELGDGSTVLARKVVLATGIQGGGEWHTPAMIRQSLPRQTYAHTSEPIDFATLKGKRIGILGGGASAFDNANWALGQGVGEVHVFMRRSVLPRINPIRFMERVGFTARYPALSDAEKYRAMAAFLSHNQPPTNDTFNRAASWPGFALHLASPWESVAYEDGQVIVTTPHDRFAFDFVILSTGLVSDPRLRPELAALAPHIALWGDVVAIPDGERNPLIDAHPYLGPAFEFTPRHAADAPLLHGLFAFNYSALISLGLSASALSGMKNALPRLVRGIADQLFLDDREELLAQFVAYDEQEFMGQWPRPASVAEAAA
ncbi:cation diffusion facilitator CzcD-associated flavoprotein CzcO [Novosphingobium sp. 1529]|uniref:NAD(P)/FAD-dependent oxidoreductase n=1 Tax=Novosphingobium sp. 1529 TaxID=3156424 RepID=UPI00339A70E1